MESYQVKVPILGFQDIDTMTLESIEGIFYRLKNEKDETPAFTLIQPAVLRDDHTFDLPQTFAEKLGLESAEDALVLNIMILDTPLEKSHINFAAPLIFNTKNHTMGQYIIEQKEEIRFGVAEPLEDFLQKRDGES